MISELARVFSSNGVLIPGAERIPVYGRKNGSEAAASFPPLFDQASAKLELSRHSRAAGESGRKVLSDEERKTVEKLEERDREVRAHEQAHIANSGGYAQGGARYEYKAGPDGKSYAVAGSVQIDTSPVPGDPQATLQKAAVIRRAAMAPADPSGADRGVAAAAARLATQARKELIEEAGQKVEGAGQKAEGAGQKAEGAGQGGGMDPEAGLDVPVREGRMPPYGSAPPAKGAHLNIMA